MLNDGILSFVYSVGRLVGLSSNFFSLISNQLCFYFSIRVSWLRLFFFSSSFSASVAQTDGTVDRSVGGFSVLIQFAHQLIVVKELTFRVLGRNYGANDICFVG